MSKKKVKIICSKCNHSVNLSYKARKLLYYEGYKQALEEVLAFIKPLYVWLDNGDGEEYEEDSYIDKDTLKQWLEAKLKELGKC